MNKNFFKKNKFTILAIVFFILLFVLIVEAKNLFFPNSGPVYGNRLDGIVEIKKDTLTSLESKLKENSSVTEVSTNVSGKTLNILITVEDSTSIDASKKIGASVLESLEDDAKNDYDIQVFISKNSEAENNFPIIGYKKNASEEFSWTKDREITTSDEGDTE